MDKYILENNKLIAKFLYEHLYEEDDCDSWVETANGCVDFYIDDSLYHKSWDWLMPVIKKCIPLEIYSSDWTNHLHDGLLFCNIQQCYESVVGFIEDLNNSIKS